ncbi:MAG: hypothetical protein WBA77_03790 [Microcoleaceae cyanobacterium]
MFLQKIIQPFTLISVFLSTLGGMTIPAMSQPILSKTPETTKLSFRGMAPEVGEIGKEYIIYQTDKNNQTYGLVYLPNSDIGACFQGAYESASNQIQDLTYAYPIMGESSSGGWEMNVSNQALNLTEFPYQLDATEIHPAAKEWFNQCQSVFQN